MENRLEADVLVIGGGIAGCFAAIKASEQGAEVILVDKGYVGKSGQPPYTGSFMAFNPEWGHKLDDWMNYINKTSEYVNNRYWTEITITESYARYQDLVSWGVPFQQGDDDRPIRYPAPPGVTEALRFDEKARGDYAQILRKQVLRSGVKVLDRIMVTELLKQGVDLRFGHRTTAMRNYVNLAVPTMPLLVADKRGAAETKIIA
jgi:succinate dehydrogenase/fumarate reductase flavoprotein subunit